MHTFMFGIITEAVMDVDRFRSYSVQLDSKFISYRINVVLSGLSEIFQVGDRVRIEGSLDCPVGKTPEIRAVHVDRA